MTRSSRPSFPPQILLRQSRARSLALFSDLTSAPLVGGWWLVVGAGLKANHQHQPPTTFSFRRLLGKTEPILLLRVAHVGAPDNLLEVDLFIRERSVAEGGRLLTQTALE